MMRQGIADIAGQQHLLPDAVVAFVDGELSSQADARVRSHLAHCRLCAQEAAAQRQARRAVQTASAPMVPGALLASLRAIPQETELPPGPGMLAVSDDGQLVTIACPMTVARAGQDPKLSGLSELIAHRRVRQGAGVVAAGLVFGALALVVMHGDSTATDTTVSPVRQAQRPVVTSSVDSSTNPAVMSFPRLLSH